MKPVSAEEMRRLDRAAVEEFHLPSLILMENAGKGVSAIIARNYEPCRVSIFVGKGNNGGDGLVVARHLKKLGFFVRILMLEDPANLKTESSTNYHLVADLNIPMRMIPEKTDANVMSGYCSDSDLIVDALFGVGLQRDIQGVFGAAVESMNTSKKPVVSIDIPSGLDADRGVVHGAAVRATLTATLALPKKGLLLGEGPECAGKIEVVDIGIPHELLAPYLE